MLVIHIIHDFIKLFTLKRSRFHTISTLKHSRFSAETLPHTIYTYIYLYKKSCSYQSQIVNNFFLKRFFSFLAIAVITFSVPACSKINPAEKEQDAALHLSQPPYRCFEQIEANELHPSEYFTCGEWKSSCHKPSKIYLSRIANPAFKGKSHSMNHLSSGGK